MPSILNPMTRPQIPSTVRNNNFIPGQNNQGMGQLPFGNQLPGNQGQGVGPSAMAIQQMLPMLLQQHMQQQPQGQGLFRANMGAPGIMPAPAQPTPPNQNAMNQNSMQSEAPEMSPRNRMFNPGSVRY